MWIETHSENQELLSQALQREVLLNKASLSTLQEDIENSPITSREKFCTFLTTQNIESKQYPLYTPLWKFLRAFRYYNEIHTTCINKGIPLDSFIALVLTEWAWSTTTINESDGGVGLLQIMPKTFAWFSQKLFEQDKNTYADYASYKLFYDHTQYASYKNSSNKAMADALMLIKKQQKSNIVALSKIDARFDPKISLNFAAEYLSYCKSKVPQNLDVSTQRKYALNAYNKWPNNYDHDLQWSHLTNIDMWKKVYQTYSQQIDLLIAQKKTGKEILTSLQSPGKPTSVKKETIKSTGKESLWVLSYLHDSKNGQYKVYKYVIWTQSVDAVKQQSFVWKDILFTDKRGNTIKDLDQSRVPKQIIYIKEKK